MSSTTMHCVSIGGNVTSWRCKKQNNVAHFSTKAEYKFMVLATCELAWIKQLHQELKFCEIEPMKLYSDNRLFSTLPLIHCFLRQLNV